MTKPVKIVDILMKSTHVCSRFDAEGDMMEQLVRLNHAAALAGEDLEPVAAIASATQVVVIRISPFIRFGNEGKDVVAETMRCIADKRMTILDGDAIDFLLVIDGWVVRGTDDEARPSDVTKHPRRQSVLFVLRETRTSQACAGWVVEPGALVPMDELHGVEGRFTGVLYQGGAGE